MFSAEYYKEIKNAFDRQMALLDQRCNELQAAASEDEKKEGGNRMFRLSERLLLTKKVYGGGSPGSHLSLQRHAHK